MTLANTEMVFPGARPAPIDPLLRSREVREMLGGICPSTLHLWRSKGMFPAPTVLCRKLYWRRSAVRQWLEHMAGSEVGR